MVALVELEEGVRLVGNGLSLFLFVILFGLLEAVANRYPNLDLGVITVPSMFMNALPYILTVIILAGFVGRAIPPRAGGEPYVKER